MSRNRHRALSTVMGMSLDTYTTVIVHLHPFANIYSEYILRCIMGFVRCLSGWCCHPTQLCIYFGGVYSPKALCGNALLGQEDSNLHSQNQSLLEDSNFYLYHNRLRFNQVYSCINLMYCHYTIARCDGWLVGFEPIYLWTTTNNLFQQNSCLIKCRSNRTQYTNTAVSRFVAGDGLEPPTSRL